MQNQSLSGALEALNRLNIIAATALGAFFMVSIVMVGLASNIVEFLEAHRFLPLAISYLLMAIAFLSSGSRDPGQYHSVEKTYVVLVMVLMAMFAWPPFVELVESYEPFGSMVSLLLMAVGTAILAR